MIVVFPNSLQYDTNQTPTFYEDHLLERISALEIRVDQLSTAIRGIVDVLKEQGKLLNDERDLIQQLYGVIDSIDDGESDEHAENLGKSLI